jgi:hypothetical protein
MDLAETAEIRSALEERLSHRAFKATAIELINRASAYQSFWKRLFGGFGVYRQEVAELFKAGCPATPTLLSDLHKLRTWHRRIDDVRETATGLAAFLPEEFAADELESWKQVEGSVQAFDRFASVVPDIAGRLPVTGEPGNPSTLGVLWAGLSHAVERLETLRSRSL